MSSLVSSPSPRSGPSPTGVGQLSKITREYTLTRKGIGNPDEPLYANDIINRIEANRSKSNGVAELDDLLDDLSSARANAFRNGTINTVTTSTMHRDRSDSTQVNSLITNLEHNLKHPDDVLQFKGQMVKPVMMTELYVEETNRTEAPNQQSIAKRAPVQHEVPKQVRHTPQVYIQHHEERESLRTPTSPLPARTPTSPLQTRTASSATRELDSLMDSLHDFEPVRPVKERIEEYEEYGRINRTTTSTSQEPLNSMIGSLETDMNKHGVDTSAKGHCSACRKPIVGQVVTALGKTWHPEHFICVHCHSELGTQNFFERNGEPYCEEDYHNLFSPRCAYCNGTILEKCTTALDQTWHPEHFFCAACGRPFGEDGYHEKDGKPYCRDDYFELFAPKCGGCAKPITDNYISALDAQWHPDCFVCAECRCPFVGGSFFDLDGLPYCETHYHLKRGSLCAGCHKPITGRCITAMFRKFHPEHFVCSFCLKQLNHGTFKEQNDKPYCHPCFDKLFG